MIDAINAIDGIDVIDVMDVMDESKDAIDVMISDIGCFDCVLTAQARPGGSVEPGVEGVRSFTFFVRRNT